MTLSVADRMYDAWATREPPWRDYEPSPLLHCEQCGGFLKHQPERSISGDEIDICNGVNDPDYGPLCGSYGDVCPGEEHYVLVWAITVNYRTCTRCGAQNKEFMDP
jgi:hypothetical protein